jgi:hypothetical protein
MDLVQFRCPKCDGEMEQGFILDLAHGNYYQIASRWAAGVPQKSWFTGTKPVPKDTVIPVGTFRCVTCGFLESYARQEFATR